MMFCIGVIPEDAKVRSGLHVGESTGRFFTVSDARRIAVARNTPNPLDGRICGQGKSEVKWFDMSTLKEPYRIEGKKTMDALNSDQKTLNGGTLTAYRKFRKNWLDGAIIGLKSEGPSKSSNWPSDVECDNGIIQAIDTVLVPGAYEGPR